MVGNCWCIQKLILYLSAQHMIMLMVYKKKRNEEEM